MQNYTRRRISKNKYTQKGFTILEVLIVLPIATLITVVLVGALFTSYRDSLAESAKTNLRVDGQTILINLQDELLFTIAYAEELESRLTDPHEPDGGWTHDTDPQTLIISEIALDSTRRDQNRHIVRQRVNNCETSSITANPLALNYVIYFVQENTDDNYSSLIKRTITPDYQLCSIDIVTGQPCTPTTTTCRGNAKQTTCPAAFVGTNNCLADDSVLTSNILDFDILYFSEGNDETSVPSAADKIELIMTLGDRVFGKDVETVAKHTIRKIN